MGEGSNSFNSTIWNGTTSNTTDAGSVFTNVSSPDVSFSSNSGSSYTTIVGLGYPAQNVQFSLSGTIGAVPEPSRAMLVACGLTGLAMRRRRVTTP